MTIGNQTPSFSCRLRRHARSGRHASRVTCHASPAFTLIELLLAVSVMAIVLAAINAVFFSALHLRNAISIKLDEAAPVEQALTVMKRDLQNVLPPGGRMTGGLQSGVMNGNATQPDGLTVYTTTGILSSNLPWGNIQEVTYRLEEPENIQQARGRDLVRGVVRNLLPTTIEEAPDEQRLLANVQQLDFAYYDGSLWQPVWDTTQTNLPYAVKITLQVGAPVTSSRNQHPIEMIVPLVALSRTNSVTTTTSTQ